MDRSLILETTFLIDLEREGAREEPGPAYRFLAHHPRHHLVITSTVAGELACGPRVGPRQRWEELVSACRVPGLDVRTC